MFPKNDDLSRSRRVLGVALGVLLFGAACATGGAGSATDAQSPVASLGDVSVETGDDGTVVRLSGLTQPVFSAFQQDDPARIVVDLSEVQPGTAESQLEVGDGAVSAVSVAGFEDSGGSQSTRIELSLSTDASFDVVNVDGGLEIRVTPEDSLDSVGDESVLGSLVVDEDPWAGTFDETASTDTTDAMATDVADAGIEAEIEAEAESEMASDWETAQAEVEATPAAVAMDESVPATLLLGIDFEGQDADALVSLRTDGRVEGFTHFLLEDPPRLVVDLPGLVSAMESSNFEVATGGIERVRVGQHPDKLRVVFDGSEGSEGLLTTRTLASNDVLFLATGAARLPEITLSAPVAEPMVAETSEPMAEIPASLDEEADVASTDATEEMEAAADSTEGAWTDEQEVAAEETLEIEIAEGASSESESAFESEDSVSIVHGVTLDRQGDRDRLAIETSELVDYHVVRPDATTLMVRLVPARLAEDAASRVVPETAGPVSLVTAFQQPDTGLPEVRVVVQRAKGLEPSMSTQGDLLVLDFMRGQDVASTPPAVTTESGGEDMPAALDPDEGSLDILEEGGLVDGKRYTGRRISLDFKDVDIDDVLRLVAEVSDLNIIAGDEVAGQVTIRLVDVPWDQALDVILLTKGLGFVRVGNVLRIAPSEQLKSEEEARLQERRAKEKLEDLIVKLQPVNYASVKEVEKMVKRLLTPRGSVDVDARTNTIILKDIASVVDEATALVKAIDTQTPQVLIEAKIVEANLDFSKELGSQWSFGTQPLVDGFDASSGNRQDLTAGGSDAVQFHNNPLLTGFTETFNHVGISNPITSVPTGLLDLGAFILDQKFNVELRLEAAESHGEGKVISSPRVVTLDNRTASIEQGVSIPFQTFENGDAKLEFIDAVLRLEVTPHITADRSIIMKIEVNRNAPDDSVQTPTGSPAIAKNEAETETLVKDGQTLVIGGIYTIEKSDRESRVPYFHKIPVLGNAFKNHETRDIRKELLVFVTPRIVVNPEVGS